MKSSLKKKKSIAVVVIIGLAALLLASPWGIVSGDNDNGSPHVKPCGVYTGVDPGGATWSQTLIPCDPASNRVAVVAKFPNISPVGPGFPLLPGSVYRTDLVGNMVRTGRNTWDYTVVGYAVAKPPSEPDPDAVPPYLGPDFVYSWPITGIIVMSGTQTFSDGGDHVTYNIAMGVWSPDDDIDPADGFPDDGILPFFSTPAYPELVFSTEGTRLPIGFPELPEP